MKNRTDSEKYIYGWRKVLVDLGILLRLYLFLVRTEGISGAYLMLRDYFRHPGNLFREIPGRYIRKSGFTLIVPDVPPVGTQAFIRYLAKDMGVLMRREPIPLLFAIVCVSAVCPYRCSYCYNSDTHGEEQILSEDEVLNAVEGLIEAGVQNIYLSGGEPLLRIELVERLLEKYWGRPVGFWLVTTGYGLTAAIASRLKSKGLRGVMVSLDRHEDGAFGIVKGKGNPEQAAAAIRNASDAGLVVVADCVVQRGMLDAEVFNRYVDYAGTLGVDFINLYIPRRGVNETEDSYSQLTISEMVQLGQLAGENQGATAYKRKPLTYSPDAFEAVRGCMGGKLFVYIGPDGQVKACPFRKEIYGNIKADAVSDMLKRINATPDAAVCKVNKELMRRWATGKG